VVIGGTHFDNHPARADLALNHAGDTRMVSAPVTGRIGVPGAGESSNTLESSISAISWPAIFGGAFAAAAFSLILLALGLASVSPWSNTGASATTFTVMTAIWLIVVQWVSAGLGGYLTGRLRTKWDRGTHP
jgi:hypothetical protein